MRSYIRSTNKPVRRDDYEAIMIRETRAKMMNDTRRRVSEPLIKTYASPNGMHWVKVEKVSTDILTAHHVKWDYEKDVSFRTR